MRFKHQLKVRQIRPDITPLIDVVFLLLIFFMLGSRFVYTTNIKVKLPKAVTGKVYAEDPVTITITKDSDCFLDEQLVTKEELHSLFKEMEEGRVAIVADNEAPFGAVIKVWDYARQHNLKEINIKTRT